MFILYRDRILKMSSLNKYTQFVFIKKLNLQDAILCINKIFVFTVNLPFSVH